MRGNTYTDMFVAQYPIQSKDIVSIGSIIHIILLFQCQQLRISALAGVAQWTEREPANRMVTGSVPSQVTRLGCEPGPQWGMCERQPHTDVSLPLFLPPFSSVWK